MSELPTISVVVVNLNGESFLAECLDSLIAQDYPADLVEIILVDNGSTDDSLALARRHYPAVHIIEAGRNLGFAGGNNLGAQVASGDYLALINNDARAHPRWLRAMAETLESDPNVACAGSKILDVKGETIDFVGTAMNLYGRAFQIDEGMPLAPGSYDEPCELLAPCGGGMMIDRDLFWEVGGFDTDYFAYYEDVDLGWRLWIRGSRVVFVPQAIVYHRQHETGARFPVEQRYTLSEANALRTLIKNLEEENLWRVLAFSLFMGVERSVEQAGLERQGYKLGVPASGDAQAGVTEPEARMTRVAASFLMAIDQIAEEMPRLMEKRREVQTTRVRSDEEIFARFPMQTGNPIFPWRRYHVVQDQLIREMGIPETLRPRHGSRLLVITHESVGARMAGPAIRAWEMACALSERFDVVLAAPGEPTRSHPDVRVVGYEPGELAFPALDRFAASADAILAMGPLFARLHRLHTLGKPSIVDLYDPFELEKLAQSPNIDPTHHLRMDLQSMIDLRLQGSVGDFFVCASDRQRDFWLGTLLAAGRINTVTYAQDPTLRSLIDVVPFGIPDDPPSRREPVLKGVHAGIAANDRLLLWNGGLWQWFDPLTLIDALVQVLASRDDVKLFFAAGKHFDPDTVPEMPIYGQTVDRCRELGLLDTHVFFGDWIAYDERGAYLLEADLGVSIHRPTLESHLSSRTRLLDCIWAGLPVISTEGDHLSELVAQRGLGRTVPPGRPDVLAQAILEMLNDGNLRAGVVRQARKVGSELRWNECVRPISAFLDRVAFAPDALDAAGRAAQARQISRHISFLEAERQHLEAVRQGRVMRLMNALRMDKEEH